MGEREGEESPIFRDRSVVYENCESTESNRGAEYEPDCSSSAAGAQQKTTAF